MTHSSRKARFDRTLVLGTWLVVAGAALPFGCAGRSESSSGTKPGEPDGFTPHADASGNHTARDGALRGGSTGAVDGSGTRGGSAGRASLGGASGVGGYLARDGAMRHSDGYSAGTWGGNIAVDGSGRGATGGAGRAAVDGFGPGDGADGTEWSDGEWSDGDSSSWDGTSNPGWADGAPDGSPG
jgi:hypothetical protein